MPRSLLPLLLLGLLGPTLPARAQSGPQGVVAVLMVEDDQGGARQGLTERVGTTAYGTLLRAGPYRQVIVLHGRQDGEARLAAAIVQAARGAAAVDVFLSIHTTRRDPTRLAALIPPAARKLRLVYSTACKGDGAERAAWEALRPRAIVTHVGINNPLASFPSFLSQWLQGVPVGQAAAWEYRRSIALTGFMASLPGSAALDLPTAEGCRPVVTGDAALRIQTGFPGLRAGLPAELQYVDAWGGSPGLVLRSLARARFAVEGPEVLGALHDLVLPAVLPPDTLKQVKRLSAVDPSRGRLQLELRKELVLPLEQGFKLVLAEQVSLQAGSFDPAAGRLTVLTKGIWVRRGLLRARVDRLQLLPAAGGGYVAQARVGVFGFIPWTASFPVGGSARPALPVETTPLFRRGPSETPGVAGALAASAAR